MEFLQAVCQPASQTRAGLFTVCGTVAATEPSPRLSILFSTLLTRREDSTRHGSVIYTARIGVVGGVNSPVTTPVLFLDMGAELSQPNLSASDN